MLSRQRIRTSVQKVLCYTSTTCMETGIVLLKKPQGRVLSQESHKYRCLSFQIWDGKLWLMACKSTSSIPTASPQLCHRGIVTVFCTNYCFVFWYHWLKNAANWTHSEVYRFIHLHLTNKLKFPPLSETNQRENYLQNMFVFSKRFKSCTGKLIQKKSNFLMVCFFGEPQKWLHHTASYQSCMYIFTSNWQV